MTAVYLHTFGCKANQYDTEVVRQALEAAGATVVDDPGCADAAVVNSCTVTHAAERKMRGLVRRMGRQRPGLTTVVMGCAAALDDGTIAAQPGVRGVVGGADVERVLAALGLATRTPDPILHRFDRNTRAWLKIQDGCDEHCTFCATTRARGANRSRPVEEILVEAGELADSAEEIVLTGVHIGTYGADRGAGTSLGELVERLVHAVPHVRFRLSSVEATEVDDRLADLMAGAPERLAPHLHAPLQSGSDRVLRRMGRHWYTSETYAARIERFAARLPAFGLGADIIVGFPGETADDHRRTVELVCRLPYTYLHVFPYSERPEAPAKRLGPPVPPDVAHGRSEQLRALGAEKATAYRTRRIGEMADVIWVTRRAGWHEGLSGDYLTAYLQSDRAVPSRGRYRLDRADDGHLVAECRGPSAEHLASSAKHHQGPGPKPQGHVRMGA